MEKVKLAILGGGARGRDLLGIIRDINSHPRSDTYYDVIGFLDNDQSKWGSEVSGVEVIGSLEEAANLSDDVMFINTIGGPDYFWKLPEIISETGVSESRFETIIHPDAYVAETATVEAGTFVFPNSGIYDNSYVGKHSQVIDSRIGHDVHIGDFTLIQGNAEVGGFIEGLCYIAKNSTIRDNSINIGEASLIGMGSVVVDDVADRAVVAGVPAKYIRDTVDTESEYEDL